MPFYLCCFVFLLYVVSDYADNGRNFREKLVYYSADGAGQNVVYEQERGD